MKICDRIGRRTDFPDVRRPAKGIVSTLWHLSLTALLAFSLFEAFFVVRGAYQQTSWHSPRLILGFPLALLVFLSIGFWAGKAVLLQAEELRNRGASNRRHPTASAVPAPPLHPRKRDARRTRIWIGTAFAAAFGLAAVAMAAASTGHGLEAALRSTGRLSLLLFWPAYAGGAAAAIFGPRFDILARRAREFGLAYAAAQLVHFSLVGGLIWISSGPIAERVMPFFAVGVVWTYLLAASSSRRLHDALGPELLRMMRTIGVEYIALVYITDFVLSPVPGEGLAYQIEYFPFSMLLTGGVLLRAASIVRGLRPALYLRSVSPRSPLRR